jgi:hypothetical protein
MTADRHEEGNFKAQARGIIDAWCRYIEPKEYYASIEDAVARALADADRKARIEALEWALKVIDNPRPEQTVYITTHLSRLAALREERDG